MIKLVHVYYALGAVLSAVAWQSLRAAAPGPRWRRFTTAAFWQLLALLFLVGDLLPKAVAGGVVLALAALAGSGSVGLARRAQPARGTAAAAAAAAPAGAAGAAPGAAAVDSSAAAAAAATTATGAALGNRLLVPVLIIPLGALAGTLGLARVHLQGQPLLEPAQATLVSLGLACALALAVALRLTGERPATAISEGRRLLDAIGWAALLPILLATLGGVLTQAKVGDAIAGLVKAAIPMDHRAVAVISYGSGMALLTMIMGNAFAAFPVMTAGVGLPLLVELHGADPAALGAIGMLTGYCGTLMTPMAANFNIVPVALLGLRDQYAVIKAQLPTALPLFVANLVLMYLLAFR